MRNNFDKIVPGSMGKIHLCADVCGVVFAVYVSVVPKISIYTARAAGVAITACLAWLLVASVVRLYSPCSPRSMWDHLLLRVIATWGVVLAAYATEWSWADGVIVNKFVLGMVLYACAACVRVLWVRGLSRFAKPVQDVLIVGTGRLGLETLKVLKNAPADHRAHVVGFVHFTDDVECENVHGLPVWGSVDGLSSILIEKPVSEVYVAGNVLTQGLQMQHAVRVCENVGMPFALPMHTLEFERAKLLDMQNSKWNDGYLHYMSTASKPIQYAVKRLVDIVASFVALLFLSPLLLGVALAIKLSSRGPVLFKQVRVGLHGSHFHLLKFRSMVVNAEALKEKLERQNEQTGPVFKMKCDPRITRVGRFIRKYSIDELPQLINILRGDMTIVGPRPALPKEVDQYKPWQRRRLSVRPGLTCYWQVGGRNSIGFEEWMQLDLRYVDHWNLVVDVQLIAQTFPVVLVGKGAS
jgi:exopolysaccharide biosynthesis polyprenyl glycosylphosphotransferase